MKSFGSSKNPAVSTSQTVWWVHPAVAFSLPCLLAGLAALLTSPESYASQWKTPKYFDLSSFGLLCAVVAVFSLGCVISSTRRTPAAIENDRWREEIPWGAVKTLFRVSFALTMFGYIVWFALAIKNGLNLQILMSALSGSSIDIVEVRGQYLTTMPGVTTATEFGLAVMVLAAPLGMARGWGQVRWQCGMVLILAALRALVNSERLAVIEVLIPFVIAIVCLQPFRRPQIHKLINLVPFIATGLLFVYFGTAEYFRSWNSFYAQRESNFWAFVARRLLGYYETALNNGALLWRVDTPAPIHAPLQTLSFLWHFPFISDVLFQLFPSVVVDDSRFLGIFASSANPEFNNISGLYIPLLDFSLIGGLLYWLVAGVVVGYLFAAIRQRCVSGVFLYPALFVPLVEASRILYWAEGRFVPSLFLLIFCVLFAFKTRGTPFILRRPVDETRASF